MASKARIESVSPAGKSQMKLATLCLVLRVLIGVVFCASGILKLANGDEFAEALASYGSFESVFIDLLSVVLPVVEIGFGASLLVGLATRLTSWMLVALLIIFSVVALVAVLQGRAVDCGCFPIEGTKENVGPALFIRNGLLVLGCLFLGVFSPRWGTGGDAAPVRGRMA
jgi:uncharacterized membrane protein YphA (DoxX/SURF4 family)